MSTPSGLLAVSGKQVPSPRLTPVKSGQRATSKVRLGLRVLSPQLSAGNGPLFARRNSPRF